MEFVSDINDSLFVYNLRAGMEVAGSETSNYYEVPDYIRFECWRALQERARIMFKGATSR